MAVQRKAFRKQSVVSEVVIAMRMHFFWCLLFVFPRYSSSNIFCSHPFIMGTTTSTDMQDGLERQEGEDVSNKHPSYLLPNSEGTIFLCSFRRILLQPKDQGLGNSGQLALPPHLPLEARKKSGVLAVISRMNCHNAQTSSKPSRVGVYFKSAKKP
jgi:hypothetical protein